MSKDNELNHLAIIMDGNGRWAKNQGRARVFGHEAGAKNVRVITEYVAKTDIKYLTLYAFSTENWSRPKTEVSALMKLLQKYLKNELSTFLKNDIRFEFIGDIAPFSDALKNALKQTREKTKHCKSLTQVLALNYGSKNEIVRAVNSIKKDEINEEDISNALDTAFAGDVDLLIRTGGNIRLSNYLLWQSAYAELRFVDTLWPEFSCEELGDLIDSYKKTHRRFGGL